MARRQPVGKIYIRIYDSDLHARLRRVASRNGLTVNQWIKRILEIVACDEEALTLWSDQLFGIGTPGRMAALTAIHTEHE